MSFLGGGKNDLFDPEWKYFCTYAIRQERYFNFRE